MWRRETEGEEGDRQGQKAPTPDAFVWKLRLRSNYHWGCFVTDGVFSDAMLAELRISHLLEVFFASSEPDKVVNISAPLKLLPNVWNWSLLLNTICTLVLVLEVHPEPRAMFSPWFDHMMPLRAFYAHSRLILCVLSLFSSRFLSLQSFLQSAFILTLLVFFFGGTC